MTEMCGSIFICYKLFNAKTNFDAFSYFSRNNTFILGKKKYIFKTYIISTKYIILNIT